ncbi:MAG: helix-turn-helix domain-containing protein [Actinomycetota bacterium]|nr:helix-turn-helix domain-containing protein [Actinomycetota bacterium]
MHRTNESKSHARQLVETREGRDLPELLRELFVSQRMTKGAIAKRLGVGRDTVARWIDEYGVDPQKVAA